MPRIDIHPEQSENDNPALNKAVAYCETLQAIYHFFSELTRTHGLVVEMSRSESGGSGSIPAGC